MLDGMDFAVEPFGHGIGDRVCAVGGPISSLGSAPHRSFGTRQNALTSQTVTPDAGPRIHLRGLFCFCYFVRGPKASGGFNVGGTRGA